MSFNKKYKDLFYEKCIKKHGYKLKLCGVYKITNLINGHFYIGSTSRSFYKRFINHFYTVTNKNYPKKTAISRAYLKYGMENFDFDILEITSKTKSIETEQRYIDELNPKYNICKIAGSCLGVKMKNSHKEKLSKCKTSKLINENEIINMYSLGLPMNSITKKYKTSSWTIKKILIKNNIELRPHGFNDKMLRCLKNKDKIIKLYKNGNSIRQCSKKLKMSVSKIREILKENGFNTSSFVYKPTKKQIEKQSKKLIGRCFSEEHKKKLRGRRKSIEYGKNHKSKKVIEKSSGMLFDSIKSASEYIGVPASTLSCWLNGSRKNKSSMYFL